MKVSLHSPYSPKKNTYKGQLHCHTTNSDGMQSPIEVEEAYRNAGYDFISITDHDYVTPDPEVSGILHINGNEETLPEGHINSILPSKTSPETSPELVLRDIHRWGGFAFMCHPRDGEENGITWTSLELRRYGEYAALEIKPVVEGEVTDPASEEGKWDYCLGKAWLRVWGVYTDDCHDVTDPTQFNVRWVMVAADELTKPAIMTGLRTGNFVCSSGPDLKVRAEGDLIIAETDVTCNIAFIKRGGSLARMIRNVTRALYKAEGDEGYIRVKATSVTSPADRAWSNPIFVARSPDVEELAAAVIKLREGV